MFNPLNWLHAFLNRVLTCLGAMEPRRVGWKSFNRKTGELKREQIPLMKKVKLSILFSPLVQWIDTTHAMRMYIHRSSIKEGKDEVSPASHN
jgi:hypothetical protein